MSLATALAEPLGETDRSRSIFFSSNKPGGRAFLSAIPLGAAIVIGTVVAIHLIARQTAQTAQLLTNRVYEHLINFPKV